MTLFHESLIRSGEKRNNMTHQVFCSSVSQALQEPFIGTAPYVDLLGNPSNTLAVGKRMPWHRVRYLRLSKLGRPCFITSSPECASNSLSRDHHMFQISPVLLLSRKRLDRDFTDFSLLAIMIFFIWICLLFLLITVLQYRFS